MGQEQQEHDLLHALKMELAFCELGGYKPAIPGRLPARADEMHAIPKIIFDARGQEPPKGPSVFRDSPSCLNYGMPTKKHACSECWLMNFVPPEKRDRTVPCHHIPLNSSGDTVATLGGSGDTPKVQEAVTGWLRVTIEKLEGEHEKTHHHAA
jgi:hypothetical protein